jgi:hypothetical protein
VLRGLVIGMMNARAIELRIHIARVLKFCARDRRSDR